tara:strand:+ start:135 stop:347 length:213 start_codon:yes stop_codon:yes gene_type:complete
MNCNDIDTSKFNPEELKKVLFIYNALNDGWTVKKTKENIFTFTKNHEEASKEIYADGYVKDFLMENFNLK